MLQNYFLLNRFLLEIKPFLIDTKIEEIFSQEKSKLIIVTSGKDENYFLELSVIPGNSYLNLRKNYSRARKNTVNFFNDLIGKKISSLEIANNDRIVKINCSNSKIFFAIRGKFTNVFCFDDVNDVKAFKSINAEDLQKIKTEFLQKTFLSNWNPLSFQLQDFENGISDIRNKYPFLGSEILKEIRARVNEDDAASVINAINQVLEEVKSSKPCVFINEPDQEVHIAFEKFKSFPFTEMKLFDNTIEAVNFCLSKRSYETYKYSKLRLIKSHLEKELKKVTNKIQNLQGVIERGSKENEYSKYGKLLLSNLHIIKNRMKSIQLEDIFSDSKLIEIKLNPELSPQRNVEYYFDKSRSEKIAFEKNLQLFEKAKKDYNYFKKLNESINEINSTKELDELMKKLKIKQHLESNEKEDLSSKFKHYIIENKYDLYVGKDSKNNDLLTTKFAKQNDYWFHSRGSSGSHAVLRIQNTKEPVPKSVLKKAASIAAFHSKAKTAGIVPVVYTFKKYVVKKKGDPSGTVHLLREDVLLVKPEIPAGCEYISSQD